MNIVFCIFSYNVDKNLLSLSVKAIERLKKLYPEHKIKTAIVNDSNDPIPDEDMPDVEIVKVTDWKRGFNLTHIENIFGQLKTYSELVEETGADLVIKMDSDTIMSRLDWLDVFTGEHSASMYGTSIYRLIDHICGYFYGMTPEVIKAMNKLISDESIEKRVRATVEKHILEDRIYTRLGQMAYFRGMTKGSVVVRRTDLNRHAELLKKGCIAGIPRIGTQWLKSHEVPIENYIDETAVTFKRRGKTEDVVSEALEGMTAFWNVLKDEPRFSQEEANRRHQQATSQSD